MSAELVDPLDFTAQALAARGALVERSQPGALAVLPSDQASALGVPDEIELSLDTDRPGTVACGLGSPLLERLLADARGRVPLGSIALALDPPRRAQAEAVAARFTVRNGLADLIDVGTAAACYVAATFKYVAEADDRYEGLITSVVDAETGGAPDEGFASVLHPARLPRAAVTRAAPPPAELGERAASWLARRAPSSVAQSLAQVRDSVGRRKQREHERIREYFAQLVVEASAPKRAVDAAAVAAKLRQLHGERDTKLRGLDERYALRARLELAVVLVASVRVASVRLRLRRRKGERELEARLPPGARSLDALACDGCPATTSRPALCDERLHLLCEHCVPNADGRPRCPSCRAR